MNNDTKQIPTLLTPPTPPTSSEQTEPTGPTAIEIASQLKRYIPEIKKNMLCKPLGQPFKISWREIKNLIAFYDSFCKENNLIDPPKQGRH